ncbi:MAG: DNA translocase FtsK 4TM domain-containing protein [Eubacteriales bacterium]|nr:DNA translocase FtsK 4TM domain-containing protein [Eubacteriales bacterium]
MAASAQKKNTKRTAAATGSTAGKTQKKRTAAKNTQNAKKHTKKSGTNSAKNSIKKKNTGKKRNTVRKEPEKNSQIWDEVLLWMILAVSVLAFLSNLGLGGSIGSTVSNALFGIFGILAYAVPVLLFFLFAFLILNKKNKIAWIKVAGMLILLIVLCAFMELIPNGYQQTKSLIDYYKVSAAQKSGGGMIGGVIAAGCCPTIGVAGTYVVLFLFAIIAFILLTEKSLFRGIEKGSKKVYHSAKEESAHCRELWENKKRQYQMQREEERAERENYWQEEETHGVANIILQDDYPIQEEEWPDTEDWLEIEAEHHKKKRQIDFEEETTEETQEEKTEELELAEPEESDEHREEMQKNFWEREERQREPIQVEIEEIDLLEEPEMVQKQENVDEIFVPQCRMTEAGYQKESEEEQQEADDPICSFAEDSLDDTEPEEQETGFVWEKENNQRTEEEKQEADQEVVQTVQQRRRERTEIEQNVTQVQAEIEGEVQQERQKYQFPPIDLLNLPKGNKKSQDMQELKETAMKLQKTLYSFGVHANVIDASCGPSVTRYELQPEQGVKVSRIVNLADDIKLNLAAADIRIEAPIPGKAAVGIEVPNKENSTVFLRELLESENFQNHPSNIVFAAGKDISGKTVVTDIAQMPHLLIAGATGSGKSVCINTIIISLLYKADPEDVKLILIDPKVVELSIYNGIPHLMIPVVTDPKKAAGALNWAVAEMTERYNKFAVMGVRDLKGYNQKVASVEQIEDENKPKKMPQIVIIVDELADLMMVAQNDVEEAIQRLTQLARAAGIHLIIATQRPSVNVITGVIKANMPSRIAFSVSSGVDSRTILDMNGAEKLLGKGDMLFFPQGIPKPVRVQGAFVSDKEVSDVVNFITSQNMPCYAKEMEKQINLSQTGSQGGQESGSDWDVYFADAGKIVIEREKASIGMLQRSLKVGFNRAARIMDQLYEAGVVGEEEGTKPRKVLMSMEQFEQYIEEYI